MNKSIGVSIIIPAYNAQKTIKDCLDSVVNQDWQGKLEVILVDDGSKDDTVPIASKYKNIKIIRLENGGAARATNIGIMAAKYDIVVSVDSDALIEKNWLNKIIPVFKDKRVAAVAGVSKTANTTIIGKIMGFDAEHRLLNSNSDTNHLYTMNTAYRKDVLVSIGMFDEKMRIGYDVDISRRIISAGFKMVLKKDAFCKHYWRDDLRGYLKQQYDYAFYRIELSRKFRVPQNDQASISLILQCPITVLILSATLAMSYYSLYSFYLLSLLIALNVPLSMKILFKKKDASVLLMPSVFVFRNFAWTLASIRWCFLKLKNVLN